jgi:hypothetical protein
MTTDLPRSDTVELSMDAPGSVAPRVALDGSPQGHDLHAQEERRVFNA